MVSDVAREDPDEGVVWGLNPCFNGIWSRTVTQAVAEEQLGYVLILVLMEYGLGPHRAIALSVASRAS